MKTIIFESANIKEFRKFISPRVVKIELPEIQVKFLLLYMAYHTTFALKSTIAREWRVVSAEARIGHVTHGKRTLLDFSLPTCYQ